MSKSSSEVNAFIFELERSAKKILKEANRRQKEEAILEKKNAASKRYSQKANEAAPKQGSILVAAGKSITSATGAGVLDSGAGISSKKIWEDGAAATIGNASLSETQIMHYSVPKMQISMSAETVRFGDSGDSSNVEKKSDMKRPPSASQLLKKGTKQSHTSSATPQKESAMLARAKASPYVTEGTGTIDEILASKKTHLDYINANKSIDAPTTLDSNWALRTKAADVLGGRQQSHVAKIQQRQFITKSKGTKHQIEAQGPIDWSTNGLRSKYRGEVERETAWQAYQAANVASTQALEDQKLVLPVASVERHPLCRAFEQRLFEENVTSCTRTKARMLMKRFVFDVQELWLTNLQHLKEHHPSNVLKSGGSVGTRGSSRGQRIPHDQVGRGNKEGDDVDEEDEEVEEEEEEEENFDEDNDANINGRDVTSGQKVRRGLKGRRDKRAVKELESQIQSVSQRRSLQRAYYTDSTMLVEPDVTLDYVPEPTPDHLASQPLPPDVENLIFGLRIPICGTISEQGIEAVPDDHSFVSIDRLIPVPPIVRPKSPSGPRSITRSRSHRGTNQDSAPFLALTSREGRQQQITEDTQSGVVWRISVMRGYDCSTCELFADESDVLDYIAGAQRLISHGTESVLEDSSELVYSAQGVDVLRLSHFHKPKHVSSALKIFVRSEPILVQHEEAVRSLPKHVRIECHVSLLAEEASIGPGSVQSGANGEEEVQMVTSAIELGFLLQPSQESLIAEGGCGFCIPNSQLVPDGLDWWTSPERAEDLWPELTDLLVVSGGEGELDASGRPAQPKLSLSYEKTAGFRSGKRLKIISTAAAPTNKNEQQLLRGRGEMSFRRLHHSTTREPASTEEALRCAQSLVRLIKLRVRGEEAMTSRSNRSRRQSAIKSNGLVVEWPGDDHNVFLPAEERERQRLIALAEGIASQQREMSIENGELTANEESSVKEAELTSLQTADAAAASIQQLHVSPIVSWETKVDESLPSLSLRARGVVHLLASVPGACAIGRKGIWYAELEESPFKIRFPREFVPFWHRSSKGSSKATSRPPSRPKTGDRPQTGDSQRGGLVRPKTSERLRDRVAAASSFSKLEIAVDEDARFQPQPWPGIVVDDGRYTEASAHFFRDAKLSSTDTVLVNLTLALDAGTMYEALLTWENDSSLPPRWPIEYIDNTIPENFSLPVALLEESLQNPLEYRLSLIAMVFSTAPTEGVDHVPLDAAFKPKGMCRHWPFMGFKGFRRKVEVSLLVPDTTLPTIVFGITTTAVIPNTTGVNTRNIWHATLPITELVNRPRVPKDYLYVIVTQNSRGPNEPSRFAVRMRSGEFIGLVCSAFENYEKEYEEIKRRREVFQRQLALDIKIEASEVAMKAREKEIKMNFQRHMQLAIEKKMRKMTKSEKGWRRRYASSQVVEIQGNWERRRDANTGLIFFHEIQDPDTLVDPVTGDFIEENYLHSCQWEVPPHWDGDPLSAPAEEIDGKGFDLTMEVVRARSRQGKQREVTRARTKQANQRGTTSGTGDKFDNYAFEQPPDSWVPNDGTWTAIGPPEDRSKTPGTRTATMYRHEEFLAPEANPRTVEEADTMGAVYAGSDAGSNASDTLTVSEATIDTANLEHIAEQLVASDELMRIIARRLGLPENQIVPVDDMSSVFSVSVGPFGNKNPKSVEEGRPLAPRISHAHEDTQEIGFDAEDEDIWSDEEIEAGDADEDLAGTLVNNADEAAKLNKEELRQNWLQSKRDREQRIKALEDNKVPHLNFNAAPGLSSKDAEDPALAWRKLPRGDIADGSKFFGQCDATRTIGGDRTTTNTFNTPVYLSPISPVDACIYAPEPVAGKIESLFIPNARKDIERAIATLDRNIKREEDLSQPINTDDLLAFGVAKDLTTADAIIARQYKEDLNPDVGPVERAMEQAILAAKSNNVAQMEDALEEDIHVDTVDQYGNSLLLLAAQQGSKRMCKFLLRRGANINFQSQAGNTVLHYCYAFNFIELAEYFKSKGADDSIVNRDQLTCYEGISMDKLE